MAKFSYDADRSTNCVCTAKYWPEQNIMAGIILYTYGNRPHPQSVCPDVWEQVVTLASNMIQDQLENIAVSEGASDIRYSAAKINDVLKQVNDRTRKISALIGLGVYLGGVITYAAGFDYITFPFGGGVTYLWNNQVLIPKGGIPENGVIRNALGSSAAWQGECWRGTLWDNSKLFCLTEPFRDISAAAQIIAEDAASDTHTDTVAMLLRRELEKTSFPPCAVMEIDI